MDRVEEIAVNEEATAMKRGYPIFTWKHRIIDSGLNTTDDVGDNMDIEEL